MGGWMEGRTRGQGKPQAISLIAAIYKIQSECKKGDGRMKGSADDKGGLQGGGGGGAVCGGGGKK
jgi:hypothetical protein